MAETQNTTEKWPTSEEINEVIAGLRAIRAIGDLLFMATEAARINTATFCDDTLVEIAAHLEDLTTKALVILKWEDPGPRKDLGA